MSLCDYCVHRDVCGTDDARAKIGKASPFLYTCDDFIDKSVLSVPEREKGTQEISIVVREKGEWIKVQSGDKDFPESIVCSKCGNENSHFDFNEHAEPIGKVFVTSKFCPNCGAVMRGE